ncbi:Melanoma-Associated Antigen E2 [Manis pentadactyla]|nr:Melanoma-Associated Antigen E2 [Manis pentadactyla]
MTRTACASTLTGQEHPPFLCLAAAPTPDAPPPRSGVKRQLVLPSKNKGEALCQVEGRASQPDTGLLALKAGRVAERSTLSLLRCLALPLKGREQTQRWTPSLGQRLLACELRGSSDPQASHVPESHHR